MNVILATSECEVRGHSYDGFPKPFELNSKNHDGILPRFCFCQRVHIIDVKSKDHEYLITYQCLLTDSLPRIEFSFRTLR